VHKLKFFAGGGPGEGGFFQEEALPRNPLPSPLPWRVAYRTTGPTRTASPKRAAAAVSS